jgi:hypothetical protein
MKARGVAAAALAVLGGCVGSIVGTDAPNTPAGVFDVVWRDFDQNYSFFQVKHIDWADVHARYAPQAAAAASIADVAPIIGRMFAELHDPHVDLTLGAGSVLRSVAFDSIHTYFSVTNIQLLYVPTSTVTASHFIRYGRISPNAGWIWISSFGGSGWTHEIDDAIQALGNVRSIIVDVRDNGGGSSSNAEDIAARFADQARTFGYVRWRNGPAHDDFTDYIAKTIGPGGTHFGGTVVVMTNRKCVSATEDFVLAMRSIPGVRFVGDTTMGGMGNPLLRELPNAWTYRLPHWIQYGPAKEIYEGIGITPDVVVRASAADSTLGRDMQIERALVITATAP